MGSGYGSSCHDCLKYLMFAFNFVFWLIGCALVGLGIWILVDDGFKDLAGAGQFQFLKYGGIAVVVVGGIIMLVGFFGCCGAIKESQCLLVMFFICMLILFLGVVAAGVACLIFKQAVTLVAVAAFDKSIEMYKSDGKSNDFLDLIQSFFKCCGKDSPLDYANLNGIKTPDSCTGEGQKIPYTAGCGDVVPKRLNEHMTIFAGVALGTGAVMLIGMIFSMILCCDIRDQN